MIAFKNNRDVSNVESIFSEINARMIAALMFHDQMSDYFDFLGMKGYKRLHEYQYFSESLERKKLNQYYINHHNKENIKNKRNCYRKKNNRGIFSKYLFFLKKILF